MSTSLHKVLSLVLLGAALTSSGCKPPPSRVNFNNDMALANQNMGKAAAEFRKALLPSAQGQMAKEFDPAGVDTSKLKTARDSMAKALKSAEDDYGEDAPLPRKSSTAPALLSAYQDYLAAQKDILAKADKIIAVLADQKFGKGEKKDQVDALLAEIKLADDKAFRSLTDAQKAYCDAHFFKIVDKLE